MSKGVAMTAATPDPPIKTPDFNSAFFWYVVLQVSLMTALRASITAGFFLVGVLFPDDVDERVRQIDGWDGKIRLVLIAALVILCIVVSSRHQLSFWRGVGLFLGGNITSTIICLPVSGLAIYGKNHPGLGWLATYALVIAGYGFACGYLIHHRRRQMLTRARQRDVVKVFD
jgi:hypothetical protein